MAFLTPEQFLALKSWVEDKVQIHAQMVETGVVDVTEGMPGYGVADIHYFKSLNDDLDEEVRKAMCGE